MMLKYKKAPYIVIFIILVLLISGVQELCAAQKKDSVVFCTYWDDFPFSYKNISGEPAGMRIDLIKAICDKAGIYCTIKLEGVEDCVRDLYNGDADISIGNRYVFGDSVYYSKKMLFYAPVVLGYVKGQPHIERYIDICKDSVYARCNSFIFNSLRSREWQKKIIPVDDIKECIQNISINGKGQILVEESRILGLKKKYSLENIDFTDINAPSNELYLVCHDKILSQKLDSVIEILSKNGKIGGIVSKWNKKNDIQNNSWINYLRDALLIGCIVAALFLAFLLRSSRRIRKQYLYNKNLVKLSVFANKDNKWLLDSQKENEVFKSKKIALEGYKTVFDEGMVDLILFTPEGKLVKMNRHSRKFFQENLNRSCKDNAKNSDFFYFMDKNYVNLLPAITWKDGIYYKSSFIPICDNDGKLIYICGRGIDCTAEIKAFKQSNQDVKILKEANKNKNQLLERISYALTSGKLSLFEYDPDKRMFTSFDNKRNPAVTYTELECVSSVHNDSYDATVNILSLLDQKEDITFTQTIRTTIKSRKGNDLYLTFTVLPKKDENGAIIKYVGTYTNSTKTVWANMQLEQERKKALETEMIKSAFLRNMSYEIRTPLNTIVGFAELLTNDDVDETDKNFFIENIRNSTSNLLSLISNSLYLSRIDTNMEKPNLQLTDFASFFNKVCKASWEKHQHQGVKFVKINPFKHITVDIDKDMTEIIIDNLISNAAHFTIAGTVKVSCEYYGENLSVIVEDTGIGINSEKPEKIFERFYKTSDSNGSGLGLSICKALTELLNGKIGIESIPGKGTLAWVSFPVKAAEIKKI